MALALYPIVIGLSGLLISSPPAPLLALYCVLPCASPLLDQAYAGFGKVDVLVNNAGFGVLGPTSDITDAEMRRQYETNVFGLMAVTRAFLPRMRDRRAGRIVNVSSVGGRITLPFFGVYNSTKYAVESLSDALRYELR
ncbi:MAG: SDR family NAD(P)-dependent oxidoreductase, partial [Pseudonocardiales bacterium]|nr:SDR family NAD(P)-dependent oxidoreductase [Pseudonocardiales bacterium]